MSRLENLAGFGDTVTPFAVKSIPNLRFALLNFFFREQIASANVHSRKMDVCYLALLGCKAREAVCTSGLLPLRFGKSISRFQKTCIIVNSGYPMLPGFSIKTFVTSLVFGIPLFVEQFVFAQGALGMSDACNLPDRFVQTYLDSDCFHEGDIVYWKSAFSRGYPEFAFLAHSVPLM